MADETAPRRIPNLWHLLLLLGLSVVAFLVAEGGVLAVLHPHSVESALLDPRTQIFVNILMYAVALLAAVVVFPQVWHRSFLSGIDWNAGGVRWWLVPAGLILGLLSEQVSRFLPAPEKMPIEDMVHNHAVIWVLVVFGTTFAPLYEEIVFRGFLLPGVALIQDWLRLPHAHTPEGQAEALAQLEQWRRSDSFSRPALLLGSVVSSLLFAMVHAMQLGGNWAPVALLFVVSMILCFVRIRMRSVAASTVVHASYNLAVFVTLLVATAGFRHLDRL